MSLIYNPPMFTVWLKYLGQIYETSFKLNTNLIWDIFGGPIKTFTLEKFYNIHVNLEDNPLNYKLQFTPIHKHFMNNCVIVYLEGVPHHYQTEKSHIQKLIKNASMHRLIISEI